MPDEPEAIAECPSCGARVAMDAAECPRCGELFAEEALPPEPAEGEDSAPDEKRIGFREKLLFYLGVALILLGGPGIALGSWLHDVLRVPVGEYDAFDAFGSVNRLVSALGLIVLIVGIVMLILSLRLSRSDVEYDIGSPKGS